MKIITTRQVETDIKLLYELWDSGSSFLLLPERGGADKEWINNAIDHIPAELLTGCFALLTSGSTGHPKLVVGSKKRSINLAVALNKLQESAEVNEAVLTLPLSYCYSFVNQWLWSKVFEKKLVLTKGLGYPEELRNVLVKAKGAMLCLVGPQVKLFDRNFGDGVSFDGIIRVHFAGGPFPQNDIDKVRRLFPNAKVFNNYGCTEAMPRLTLRPESDSGNGANVGKPLPGIKMRVDEDDKILFISPYSAVGYFEGGSFNYINEDTWVPSGDLGEEQEDKSWVIKGRANEVFKRFGEKISIPQLLNTVRSSWQGESEFYREKSSDGEEGHVLVLSPHPTEKEYRDILVLFRKNHPRPHWPIRLEGVDSFPLLPNGKIDKIALKNKQDKTIYWYQRT